MQKNFIVFSDLDGTLLDHHSYKFDAALSALDYIKDKQIPLILVSSKTRTEMIYYQELIDIKGYPYVVENGSAVFTPLDFFENMDLADKKISGNYDCYRLGISYKVIRDILDNISRKHGYHIRGFHNLSRQEIQDLTELEDDALGMALKREYSIPLLYDKKAESILEKELDNYGLQILYGGRFMHLLGRTDKGKAMRLIQEGYREKFRNIEMRTIAIGDSRNDLAMLRGADYAVLVKKYDNSWDRGVNVDDLILSPGIGPSGWNISVLNILKTGG